MAGRFKQYFGGLLLRGLSRSLADRVVRIGFVETRRERCLRHSTEGIVGEISGVAVRVGDAEQIIFRVVGVGGDVAGGVGDCG